MLRRKIKDKLDVWFESKMGLILFGARQVGKTYLLNHYLKRKFNGNVYDLNLHEKPAAIRTIIASKSIDDFFLRLSAINHKAKLLEDTCIFIDEIQEYYSYLAKHPEIEEYFDLISETKYIELNTKHRIVFSGSLLRLEMNNLITNPNGALYPLEMYPMDFEEFLWANGVDPNLIEIARNAFNKKEVIPDFIHDLFLDEYRKYILVGGMPYAVSEFVNKNSFAALGAAHRAIEYYIGEDITKYANDNEKLKIREIYDLIPTELSSPSRKFFLSHIPDKSKNNDEALSFAWLNKAGVSISCYAVSEPVSPLLATSKRNQFKLFHEDVGLLSHLLFDDESKLKILNGEQTANLGALYENSIAQQLRANVSDRLYYYNSKKYGEVDFLLEKRGIVLPIEVKSGSSYIHRALNNIMDVPAFHLDKAICLYNENIKEEGKILYVPVYCVMFFKDSLF